MSEEQNKAKEQAEDQVDSAAEETQEQAVEPSMEDKFNELNDKYLRLYSEFDNFRRRTAKERLDLFKNAGEEILTELLPVLDDFERATQAMTGDADIKAISEGINLVHQKFRGTLEGKGLRKMEVMEKAFDPDYHEAITKIPAPKKKLKGKVVDVIEHGYLLNDKVIRYAKVVVGE